jgi:hypothetical protein
MSQAIFSIEKCSSLFTSILVEIFARNPDIFQSTSKAIIIIMEKIVIEIKSSIIVKPFLLFFNNSLLILSFVFIK